MTSGGGVEEMGKTRKSTTVIEPGTLIASAVIPGLPPSVNGIWRIKGRGIYKTQAARAWQETASICLRFARKVQGEPYEGPVCYLMTVLAEKIGRKRDTDNMTKSVQDSLQIAGLIADDSQVQDFRVVRIITGQPDQTAVFLWAGERLPEDEMITVLEREKGGMNLD
jgi:Holliday junction resolvase RusA-like endonuclease